MTTRTGMVLLLLGLPLLAAAETEADPAQCARLAASFGSSPRSLSISDLDVLRSCIELQQTEMRRALEERGGRLIGRRYTMRPSLRDDF